MFYVYVYYDDNVPIYVGKGKGKRAWSHLRRSGNHGLREFLSRYGHRDLQPSFVLRTTSELEALAHERALIALYGRVCKGTGTLFNLAAGGCVSGSPVTAEVVQLAKSKLTDEEFVKRWKRLNRGRTVFVSVDSDVRNQGYELTKFDRERGVRQIEERQRTTVSGLQAKLREAGCTTLLRMFFGG